MTTCAQGAMSRLCVEPGASPHTFDSNSEPYEFLHETLPKSSSVVHANGITGSLDPPSERARRGPSAVGGSIFFNIDPLWLDAWLPRILGTAENANLFELAQSLPSFGVLINRVTQTFRVDNAMVNYARFYGAASGPDNPQPVVCEVNIIGLNRDTGTSYPSLTLGTSAARAPYLFEDAAVTVGGTTRYFKQFYLTINNHLYQRRVNSLWPTKLCPSQRSIQIALRHPFDDDHSNLIDPSVAGQAVVLTFTNGTYSFASTMACVQFDSDDPIVPGKTEIDYWHKGVARSISTTAPLSITSNSS